MKLVTNDGKEYQLNKPIINIGHSDNNDVVLKDPLVSRYHAQLRHRRIRLCYSGFEQPQWHFCEWSSCHFPCAVETGR